MTATLPVTRPTATVRGHWIDDWRPEDPAFWEHTGARVARRNLAWSIFSEHIGFSVWTMWSLLVPSVLAAVLIEPGVSYTTLLILSAIAGVGGGNFASSMANINAYYPDRLKGWALGINAGGGNPGVAAGPPGGLFV